MFFAEDRIAAIREMICSDTVEQREKALAKLEPMQQGDFEGIYEAMQGNPVTIRFLDPPLHEFVPTEEADIKADHIEGRATGWVLLEYKGVIAHIFIEESRNYYNLERLWEDGTKIDISGMID